MYIQKSTFIIAVLFFGVFWMNVPSVDGRKRYTRAIGRILCRINGHSEPVKFVKVRLRDRDLIFHDTYGSTRTDSNGNFNVSGRAGDTFGLPDPFIEVEYEYSGLYGCMEVQQELFGINRQEKTGTRSHSSFHDFGNIYFSGDHCNAYVMTLRAMEDYSRKTGGKSLPYSCLKVVTKAPIHGGTPYSTTDKIRIPSGYNSYDSSTAEHELAHTIRHSLDGSFFHFLRDVVKYNYLRNHYCGLHTNNGYAFNEGWAEFWEDDCKGTYGNSPTNYTYEGNVAKALRSLKSRCGSSYRQIVEVLQNNRGRIHSYNSFETAHCDMYGCC